jgi:hypothetical protein
LLLLLLLPPPPLLLLLTHPPATVKDLRRQVSDFKSEIIKLQDALKSRDADYADMQRKAQELEALTQMQVDDAVPRCFIVTFDMKCHALHYCKIFAGAAPGPLD